MSRRFQARISVSAPNGFILHVHQEIPAHYQVFGRAQGLAQGIHLPQRESCKVLTAAFPSGQTDSVPLGQLQKGNVGLVSNSQ